MKKLPTLITLIMFGVIPTSLFGQEQNERPILLSGLSLSEAYEIEDDVAFRPQDKRLIQLLYRIKKTSPRSRSSYSSYTTNVSDVASVESTEDYRLWLFDRKVTLIRIQKIPIEGSSPDDDIVHYFLARCKNDAGQPIAIATPTIPRKLPIDVELNEQVGFEGFLYKRAILDDGNGEKSRPLFIANRLKWFPYQKSIDALSDSHVELAKRGMDIGLLDVIEEQNTKPLGTRDAEAFYQLLANVKKSATASTVEPPLDFQELMRGAKDCFGKSVKINGHIRFCREVPVTDEDIQKRLDLDKYYQLFVFPDLDGKKIVIKGKEGKDDVSDRFPITVCCPELPDGLSREDVEKMDCTIDGYVFRFWKFQSERTDESGFSGQVSPLIMVKDLTLREADTSDLDWLIIAFAVVLVGGFIAVKFSHSASDKKHKTRGQQILDELPDEIDVTGIE